MKCICLFHFSFTKAHQVHGHEQAVFLFSFVQVLNCYYEAYQHAAGTEERFALARVITDIMHSRPQLDLNQNYFVQAYRAEIGCLQSHQQLIRDILDNQVKTQSLQRILFTCECGERKCMNAVV